LVILFIRLLKKYKMRLRRCISKNQDQAQSIVNAIDPNALPMETAMFPASLTKREDQHDEWATVPSRIHNIRQFAKSRCRDVENFKWEHGSVHRINLQAGVNKERADQGETGR